ncbi:DUF362 domain-containing protein [Haliscomenobacter hydrossis]|uniref:DUF362 domain-containing protein n=1 Tax=Haliscomenobacter hydrossis (strain ATCC 27775 / DSM 1100 / LMG 10767 / O) TaxID=760192 RepID=F4L047_HALH1|nr:DUF362 domain-containing protein [Haliscomenobacter hydrossis]AEE52756.1 hypothetical protein Halhy_4928 [Haliscomenobacter hydrossis DSM 1100]
MIERSDITPSVGICTAHSGDVAVKSVLGETLVQANFIETIERERQSLKLEKADFRILIHPDFELFDYRGNTGTDPQVVEALIDLLQEQGYPNVVLANAENDTALWLENRDVLSLADLGGYRFTTDRGHPYDVLNLSESLDDGGFPAGSILAGTSLSTHWQSAHFRIIFCKNKTDEEQAYALGLHNLLASLPLRAKTFHYQHRLKKEEVALDLYLHSKIHFTIVDAWQSNHGYLGNTQSNPLATHTFIASADLLLADWIAALKMGLDPYLSNVNATVFRQVGLPVKYTIKGDLSPYPGWKNVPIHLRESAQKRNQSPLAQRFAKVCIQAVNTELFPFKNIFDQQLNSIFSTRLQHLDQNPAAYWGLIVINNALANLESFRKGWQIMFDKDRLNRIDSRLNINLEQISFSTFEEIEDYILPLQTILQHTPTDRNGLRRRYIDGSVIFEYVRIIPVPYDDFIKKVDICQAVQMMYDNIGGTRVTVTRDEQGRVIHQAERDIYLPQPNWMVLFGGKHIDVDKIERIKYDPDQQHNYWRSMYSANQSADYDDGLVSFARDPGGVRIVIVARQKFALPLFWQVFNLDYLADVKETLVSDAYNQFFSRTIANFEAAYEGRFPFIGKTLDQTFGEENVVGLPSEAEQLKDLFLMLVNLYKNWINQANALPGFSEIAADEHGFRHFVAAKTGNTSQDAAARFVGELMTAIGKDIQLLNPK